MLDTTQRIINKIDFEEKWLMQVFNTDGKISLKDVEIAMSAIRHEVIGDLEKGICGGCKHYCHDIDFDRWGEQIMVAYCDKGKYVGSKNSGACELFEKAYCVNCILDGTDACSRGAGRAVDDEICEDYIGSKKDEG